MAAAGLARQALHAAVLGFVHPITVLVALPFSLSGAFLALLAMDLSLNVYSMIGLILLMGIVKKNSILLVDFTNLSARGRYVRVLCTRLNATSNYSLYDLNVYGV